MYDPISPQVSEAMAGLGPEVEALLNPQNPSWDIRVLDSVINACYNGTPAQVFSEYYSYRTYRKTYYLGTLLMISPVADV